MSDMESRLTEAMKARARDVEPRDEDAALERITRRGSVRRRRAVVMLGAAAAIAVAIGAIALLRRDDDKSKLNVTTKPSTSSSPSATSSSSTLVSVAPSTPSAAIWPFDATRAFATPEAAAKSFAVDYLGMTLAQTGSVEAGYEYETNVEVFATGPGTARTVVRVTNHDLPGWVVLGSAADEISIDEPRAGDALTSSVTVSGKSTAFEAQIALELRPRGLTTPVVRTSAMGGSNGEIGPFSTTINPPATDQPLVLVVYEPDASDRGKMIKATVLELETQGAPQPSDFIGLTAGGDLVHLDFAGHVQNTLAANAVEYAYAPTTGLLAYTHAGGVCGIDFVSVVGGSTPARIDNAIAPVFSPGGEKLAFTVCGDRHVAVRTLATGDQTDGVPDFVPTLPNQTGTLATLRGRFGTVAFYNGRSVASYNPADGKVVELVRPNSPLISLDADESGRYLIWTDGNLDVWTWSGGEPAKVASGFNSAAW